VVIHLLIYGMGATSLQGYLGWIYFGKMKIL